MDNEIIATALRMIGKNIMLIADAICKEDESAAVEEKPKKRTRKTAKAEPKLEVVKDEATEESEPVPEEEKPKITFEQVRAALANKSRDGYSLSDIGLSTADISESPKGAEESILSAILQETVDSRYLLSAVACRGILQRASKRGKALPALLKKALEQQAERMSKK